MDFRYTLFLPSLFSDVGSEVQRSEKMCPRPTALGQEQNDHSSLPGGPSTLPVIFRHQAAEGCPPMTQLLSIRNMRMLSVH